MPQSITLIGREELISQENLQFDALTFPFLSSEQAYNEKKLAALSVLHKAKKAYYACDVIRFLVPYAARLKLLVCL